MQMKQYFNCMQMKLLIWVNLELIDCVLTNNKYWIELLVLGNNTWNHLTVCKQMNYIFFKYLDDKNVPMIILVIYR